ncbi:hypothetical protein FOMPIDRAFT_1026147 [Fomitopsis schrenkii]|uniref:RanBP2-type domain-containing protein n=1 Tax=Fomitopsis schrenkii TaxID=2126942 RepID=S8DM26_FOMSC|nr:hypothetical protein FOMPIDRAFT_1026147 [Fomitopsis schrenkii]
MPATNGHSRPKRPSVEIEEVPDIAFSGKSQTYTLPSEVIEPGESSKSTTRGVSPTSTSAPLAPFRVGVPGSGQDRFRKFAPTRPSSLRNQVSVDKEDAPEPFAPPPAPKPAFASISKPSAPPVVPAPKPIVERNKLAAAAPKDAIAFVLAKSVRELPTFTLTIIATHLDVSQLAKDKARTLPQAKLPTYDLKALSSPGAGPSKAPAASSSSKGFNWDAAGMAKPTPTPAGSWTCSTCMCANDAKATEKCAVCEAPRPGAPKAPAAAFNWGAAGIAKPKAKEGSWTCSTCMCSNGAEVTEKCTVCEAPRPR